MDIADLRKEYGRHGLSEADLDPDPIQQFRVWFDQASRAGVPEPNAMTLATCTPDGFPSVRIVLLKVLDERGFTFFTSYQGRKAKELAVNPRAALLFYWAELERQVRIEGPIEQTTPEESDAYFRSRPAGSQLGAWASQQSEVIAGRQILEERARELETRFQGQAIPRPPFWGGFRLEPLSIEFWQGRPSRLHDRLRYQRANTIWTTWILERLSP